MNSGKNTAIFDAQLMRETLLSERLRATLLASVAAVIGLTFFLLSRLGASEFLVSLRQHSIPFLRRAADTVLQRRVS